MTTTDTEYVLQDVNAEREAQTLKWGEQNHADGTGLKHDRAFANRARILCNDAAAENRLTWRHILDEEVAEAYAETDDDALRAELVQVAAVVVAWVEAIDRRRSAGEPVDETNEPVGDAA